MRVHAPSRKVLLGIAAATAVIVAACIPPPTGGGGPNTTVLPTLPPAPPEDELVKVPVLEGLSAPTSVEFANDGRVYVAEKAGILKTYDSIEDTTPTVAADLRAPVRNTGDHGFLGLTVDPQWPTRPFVYVLHAWDKTGLWGDGCAGGQYGTNGCVTGGMLSRLTMDPADGTMVAGPEVIVDHRWCFQFSSHGVGDLQFLDDGTLLVSAGEGASWVGTDYGQRGGQWVLPPTPITPVNPCDDPPNGIGGPVDPVTSEGGAFRSQDLLTPDDPQSWDGSLVRLDPDTGAAPADNPLVGDGNPDNDHVLAHGLRNPFRFTVRPGTNEVYLADVGLVDYEEINKVTVGDDEVPNFGWPCREGPVPNSRYEALGNVMCDLMHEPDAPSVSTDPWFAYARPGTGASIAGIEFIPDSGQYAEDYVGSVLFADYVMGETFLLGVEPDGSPDPAGPRAVMRGGIPVDLTASPDGFVYLVDYINGTVSRLVDRASSPVAQLTASATDGPLPLQVELDASGSTGPDGEALVYEWDLSGDGVFDDATGTTASVLFTEPENRTVAVRVSIPGLGASVASTTIYAGNTPPELQLDITSPLPWLANGDITFEISATDAEDGPLPESSIDWEAQIIHCYEPDDCHVHPYTGGQGFGATISGPSHGYPSYLTIIATATDSRGQSVTVTEDVHPDTVELEVTSDPPGATVSVGEFTGVAPYTVTVIKDDLLSITSPSPQEINGVPHVFSSWDHGSPRNHDFSVGLTDTSIHINLSPQ